MAELPQAGARAAALLAHHALFAPRVALFAALVTLMLFGGSSGAVRAEAIADHLMCGWQVEPRTQTVSIDTDLSRAGVTYDDVLAAFVPWNELFEKYYGFPIFAPYEGIWQDADILLTAHGSDITWVDGKCIPGYVQRGSNHSVVFLGATDAWRNASLLPHELGHTLGLADHGVPSDQTPGHVGFKLNGNYIGVMSYESSPSNWFMDVEVKGFVVDGDLVASYWPR